jgi:hypothetical protein
MILITNTRVVYSIINISITVRVDLYYHSARYKGLSR